MVCLVFRLDHSAFLCSGFSCPFLIVVFESPLTWCNFMLFICLPSFWFIAKFDAFTVITYQYEKQILVVVATVKDVWSSDVSWFSALELSVWLNNVSSVLQCVHELVNTLQSHTSIVLKGMHLQMSRTCVLTQRLGRWISYLFWCWPSCTGLVIGQIYLLLNWIVNCLHSH